MRHLDAAASAEIIRVASTMPRFKGGPQADFTDASEAFAVNVTLLHDPEWRGKQTGRYVPTPDTQALLTQRGEGSLAYMWSGVSGFIGHSYDPARPDGDFDPISYTAYAELQEECGLTREDVSRIALFLGERFTEPYGKQGTLHVMPLVGVCDASEVPPVTVDGRELIAAKWVALGELAGHPDLTPEYAQTAVTRALGGLGLSRTAAEEILNLS